MQKIIVTPAGRQEYLSILYRHLLAQRNDFDEWRLWLNTVNKSDIDYCQSLAATNNWIKLVPLSVPHENNFSICSFFPACADPNSVYLRLDDDIVWLEPAYVRKMFEFRLANPEFFLVFGNIVNNAVVSHVLQRVGVISTLNGIAGYDTFDHIGWVSGKFAETLHMALLQAIDNGTTDEFRRFDRWVLFFKERCSINSISWLGSNFATFGGAVGRDEEQWLASDHPKFSGQLNVINGQAVCAHFAFHTQRAYLKSSSTDILGRYRALAEKL